jgi:hypothetical protein
MKNYSFDAVPYKMLTESFTPPSTQNLFSYSSHRATISVLERRRPAAADVPVELKYRKASSAVAKTYCSDHA